MYSAFQFNQYLIKKQAIALTGKIRIYSPDGALQMFSEQKMFKLREDIRVFSDESKTQEVLAIRARQIIDFSASYDVLDPMEGKVGALRRKGLRSILRDEWEVLNTQDQVVAIVTEDSVGLALLRRLLAGSLVPQNYDMLIGTERVGDFKQRFNLFRYEMDVDLSMDAGRQVDHRLGLAMAILLAIVEGKQSS